MTDPITVRRATPTDYLTSPRLLGPGGETGGLSLDRGYFLAEQEGHLVGCIGWQVENLVARLDDLRLPDAPLERQGQVLERLLQAVHQAARELECEVVLLAMDPTEAQRMVETLAAMEYERQAPDALARYHREAAEEILQPGQTLWVCRLRAGRVTRPL